MSYYQKKSKLRRFGSWLADLAYDFGPHVLGLIMLSGLLFAFIFGLVKLAEESDKPDNPATIHVSCVGKYLVFENLESHDIEVAGPCSK